MTGIRVGIFGYGNMGRKHAETIGGLHGVQVIAIVDPRLRVSPRDDIKIAKSPSKAIFEDLDAVIVATPNETHLEMAKVAIQAGVPVLLEKPIAASVAQAKSLLNFAQANQARVMVGQIERFNPVTEAFVQLMKEGTLGTLVQIRSVREGPPPSRFMEDDVAIDLAIHDIDLVRFLTGSEYSWIGSESRTLRDSKASDSLIALGSLQNGASVGHSINWVGARKARYLSVVGERGAVHADLLAGKLYFRPHTSVGSSTPKKIFVDTTKDSLTKEHEAFVRFLRGSGPNPVSLEDAIQSLEVVERLSAVSIHDGGAPPAVRAGKAT